MTDEQLAKMMAFIEVVMAGNDHPTKAQVQKRIQKNRRRQ